MPDEMPISARSRKGEERYQRAKLNGETKPLEEVESIIEWDYWRVIPNDYPLDLMYSKCMMVIPKRVFPNRWDMNYQEMKELEDIYRYYGVSFDQWIENMRARSVKNHFHIHLVKWKESRKDITI